MTLRITLITVCFFLFTNGLLCQAVNDSDIIDTKTILAYKNIAPHCFFYSDAGKKQTTEEVNRTNFTGRLTELVPSRRRIPTKYISANNYLRFTIHNTSDSIESFYPKFCSRISYASLS